MSPDTLAAGRHSDFFGDLFYNVDAICRFFAFCVKENFRLHPRKCTLFVTEVRWRSRLIRPHGISFDPRLLDSIRHMPCPHTGADLQQFLCAMHWMRPGIPKFSTIVGPLASLHKHIYVIARKRRRRAAAKVFPKPVGWEDRHCKSLAARQRALEHQVALAHVDLTECLCVFTDATDLLRTGGITQAPCDNLNLPVQDQRHEPLAFLSERLRGSELRWSTVGKKAYATMVTVDRMHWLLATN